VRHRSKFLFYIIPDSSHICHPLSHNYITHMCIYKLLRYYMSPLQRTGTDLVQILKMVRPFSLFLLHFHTIHLSVTSSSVSSHSPTPAHKSLHVFFFLIRERRRNHNLRVSYAFDVGLDIKLQTPHEPKEYTFWATVVHVGTLWASNFMGLELRQQSTSPAGY
jgi:hypothetical protein